MWSDGSGTVAGSEGRDLCAAGGAPGPDPEETARRVPAAGYTNRAGPGGAGIAMLVLGPIFEADLEPEQYGYRPERSALDAVRHIHRLLNRGHNEVVDGDLTNYFGRSPTPS